MHAEMKSTKKENLHERRGPRERWVRGLWLGLGIWALVGLVSPSPSQAVDFHCPSGDVACLINAINVANANGVPNTIQLEEGTYTLTTVNNDTEGPNGLPSITGILTIGGREADETILERRSLPFPDTPIIPTPVFRVLHVAAGADLTLEHLTISGGNLSEDFPRGGGILNRGTLTLDHSTVQNNGALDFFDQDQEGIGIWNAGKLTLEHSTVARNIVGFFPDGGNVTGGGIWNSGDLIIHQSAIINNRPAFHGQAGGIFNEGLLEITHSRVEGNGFGLNVGGGECGGILNLNQAKIEHTSIADNLGSEKTGGICNHGTMTISESTIHSNGRNGIANSKLLTITNSTIAGHDDFAPGGCPIGAIHNSGDLAIINSTIADNRRFNKAALCGEPQSPGLANVEDGRVHLQNSILARNGFFQFASSILEEPWDCSGPITSLGHNLIGTTFECDITLQVSDLTGDPGLGAFTDDGTPGNGHFPLLATSQAINAANDAACPPADQLGTPRPVEPGAPHCDMGAIEFAELVNEVFALTQLTTAFNPTAGPDAPAGVFTITATFTHAGGAAISQPFFRVTELSGQNVLLNANGEPGGVGATLTPTVPDGGVQSGETFTAVFEIGLQELQGFTFFVDLYGVPEE